MLKNGDVLEGRYEILGEIGAGGIGVIYLAMDRNLQKQVVVKKIKEHYAGRLESRAEVDILKNLHHVSLPQVYDFIQYGTQIYTVMDYIRGRDLQQYLDSGYVFREEKLLSWLWQLLDVLDYLHSQKPPIYHCDIKPANIMVTEEQKVCLIDFNISLGDEEKTIKGISQWYCAPEQRQALFGPAVFDQRMDLYSLGAVFYALMTGWLPSGQGESAWPEQIGQRYSSGLTAIIQKAMAEDPGKRFGSAKKMQAALLHIYRWDRTGRKIRLARAGIYTFAGILAAAGTAMLLYGKKVVLREEWTEAYRAFTALCETQDYEKMQELGMELLNSREYGTVMTGQEKGTLLWQAGESFFWDEDYASAADYYQEALEYLPGETDLCRDFAVALVREGETREAERFLEEAKDRGLQSDSLELVEGEIARAQGDTERASEIAQTLFRSGSSREIRGSAARLAASLCADLGYPDYEAAWLEAAKEYSSDKEILRRLCAVYMELAEQGEQPETYLDKALENARLLVRVENAPLADSLTLAVALILAEEWEEAEALLSSLAGESGDDYRVPMYQALLSYNQEVRSADPDFAKFRKYCGQAETLSGGNRDGDALLAELLERLSYLDDGA